MSPLIPGPLALRTTMPDPRTARIDLDGDLDYSTADRLVDEAVAALATGVAVLRLNCAGLAVCDSSGLSAFLTVRRRARAAGAELVLDGRTRQLDRLMELTGTLTHLTGESSDRVGHADPKAPDQGRPGHAEPGLAEPGRAEPGRAESGRGESGHGVQDHDHDPSR